MGRGSDETAGLMNKIVFSSARCCKQENCVVRNHAICKAVGPTAAAEFDRYSHLHTFKRGQMIVGQGEDSVLVGNIISGIVKLTVMTEEGDQQIVGLLYPSDFFGRVYSDKTRFSYEAATDVALCAIDRMHFERLMERHPEVEHELLVHTLHELDAARGWISLINNRTTMQRVCTLLFILMKRLPATVPANLDSSVINLPVGRRDIASFLGTTPETLSRSIQSLSRQGVIKIIEPNLFVLLDEPRLLAHAGELGEDIEFIAGLGDRPPVPVPHPEPDLLSKLKIA